MKLVYCFISFSLLFLFECENQKRDIEIIQDTQVQKLSLDQKYLVGEFKENFFFKCLLFGFNNEEIKTCLKDDASPAGDFPLGIEGYRMIDSLALLYRDLIIKDSLLLVEIDREYDLGKKRIIQVCLQGYDGKIDSIARKRYGPK